MKNISKKSNTVYLLQKYHIHATKKLGQNFIIDTNIVQKIVKSTGADKETCVIEIGPGLGALSEYLSKSALRVIAFEKDERLKDLLAESLSECDNVEVIFEDFMKVDLNRLISELRKKYKKISFVANLPYYITSDIIEKIIRINQKIDSFTVMMQKEVAEKLMNETSPLSLMMESRGKFKFCFNVSQYVFFPSPHVDSAVVRMDIFKDYDEKLDKIIKLSFTQKRKTIYNNLKTVFDDAHKILDECHIDSQKRAQDLSLDDFKALSHYL